MANGLGVALESPTEFAFNPMQINTRNPARRLSASLGRAVGRRVPTPSQADRVEGRPPSGRVYSIARAARGRMIKTFDHHLVRDATPCTHASAIPDAAECFAAAAKELRSAWLQNV